MIVPKNVTPGYYNIKYEKAKSTWEESPQGVVNEGAIQNVPRRRKS